MVRPSSVGKVWCLAVYVTGLFDDKEEKAWCIIASHVCTLYIAGLSVIGDTEQSQVAGGFPHKWTISEVLLHLEQVTSKDYSLGHFNSSSNGLIKIALDSNYLELKAVS